MKPIKTYYKRNLPHILPIGERFFITFRLYDAFTNKLIAEIIEKKKATIQTLLKTKPFNYHQLIRIEKKYALVWIDKLLDNSTCPIQHLANEQIAILVKDRLHELDGKYYNMLAYCIMPNHVHLVLDTLKQIDNFEYFEADVEFEYVQLYEILKFIKGQTGFYANKILKLKGRFWQRESFDHIIRDEKELENIIWYILENPVKAGLTQNWNEWKWSYVSRDMSANMRLEE